MPIPSMRSAVSLRRESNSEPQSGPVSLTNNNDLNEISHIEFSRHLNDSSSSSRSTSPTFDSVGNSNFDGKFEAPRLPMSSSPILNNNNHIKAGLPPKLPPRKKMATVPAIPR